MNEQLSIFDFMKPPERNLDDLTEKEMVEIVGDAIGVQFKLRDTFWGYQAKVGKGILSCEFSNYTLDDNHNRFISCDCQMKHKGFNSPCDSIDGAVNFFRKAIQRIKEDKD